MAVIAASSALREAYAGLVYAELRLGAGGLSITEDVQHWVNDALMAVFFFVVGLEMKRELVTGDCATRARRRFRQWPRSEAWCCRRSPSWRWSVVGRRHAAAGVSLPWLASAVTGLVVVLVLRRLGVTQVWPYVVVGLVVWLATFESGVHATIPGVALGL